MAAQETPVGIDLTGLSKALFAPLALSFEESSWRVYGHDDEPFEGEAPEAWDYFVESVDRYGFVDRVEEQVDGSWRRRSVRDLLDAAGGDPL